MNNSAETVVGIAEKLLRENAMVCKWKTLQSTLLVMYCNWIRTWNLSNNFFHYDNSKKMERLNTRWSTPPPSWLKLNFDGVAHSGVAKGGGIIRDSLGNLILAYARNFDSVSSNMVEALALFWVFKLALDINTKRLIIEGDSKLIIEAAKGVAGISWTISNIIKDIWSMIIWLEEFQIQHIYREGNSVADSLVATGLELTGMRCWRHLDSLSDRQKSLIGRGRNFSTCQ
ncbi:uncharacterized protein LOC131056352 [Cryptomeria japonica]|uniref:uncharacterized protein LOC131056352 n=1 Tax=Cryptomeria japonica TaxID=3369 RepID=UPI0027D9E38D|nr:uncharacterized protein LOC131056352 [Cryptomeria japonica]